LPKINLPIDGSAEKSRATDENKAAKPVDQAPPQFWLNDLAGVADY